MCSGLDYRCAGIAGSLVLRRGDISFGIPAPTYALANVPCLNVATTSPATGCSIVR